MRALSSRRRARALDHFSASLGSIVGIDQLLSYVASHICEAAATGSTLVALRQPVTNRYAGRAACGGDNGLLEKLSFGPGDRLVQWLATNRQPLDTLSQQEVLAYLSPRERALLDEARISLVLPAFVFDRISALFFLGPRAGRYSRQEQEILSGMAAHSALAIEFATLRQFQEDRLRKLELNDKLSMIGRLASTTAHDVRHPLTLVRSRVQLLGKYLPKEKHELSAGILAEVDRVNAMLENLLALSRTGMQRSPVDLRDLILSTMPLFDGHITRQVIELSVDVPSEPLVVTGDASQLRQALMNVVMNSIQAMPRGGELLVSGACVGGVAGPPCKCPLQPGGEMPTGAGGHIELHISDTGPGIPQDLLSRVLEPFFTTREGGTGLGLSIAYGIIANHGGDLLLESSTDPLRHGTQVTIRLSLEQGLHPHDTPANAAVSDP